MLFIRDVRCFLPNNFLNIIESHERLGISKSQSTIFNRFYGLENISVAYGFSALSLLKKSLDSILENNTIDRKQIKFLIHAHTGKIVSPFGCSLARDICQQYGFINADAFSLSVNNCASVLTALEMSAVLLAESDSLGMIVCGDLTYTPVLQVIPHISILGEASGALLVSATGDKNRVLSVAVNVDGRFARLCLPPHLNAQFENTYAEDFANTIQQALNKANIPMSHITLIIPHNINIPSWKKVANQLKIPIEKIYLDNVKKYGHCFGSDSMINYCSAMSENKILENNYYVIATVGLGCVYAAAVVQH